MTWILRKMKRGINFDWETFHLILSYLWLIFYTLAVFQRKGLGNISMIWNLQFSYTENHASIAKYLKNILDWGVHICTYFFLIDLKEFPKNFDSHSSFLKGAYSFLGKSLNEVPWNLNAPKKVITFWFMLDHGPV